MRRPGPHAVAAAAVCLAACLPYLRTIPDYFVQDDFGGMQLLAAKPWHTFPRWFTMPWMEFIWGYTPDEIRPFTALSYQITTLWRADLPHGHHLLNIALHAANSLLVLGIARAAAGLTLPAATVAAMTFALLPVGAESAAWITGRVDSLPAFFYLLSFFTYVRWRQNGTGSPRLYIWSLVWFFMALFSKQNTITMVAALIGFDVLLGFSPRGRPVAARGPSCGDSRIRVSWDWVKPYVPFALLTAGFLGLRYLILGEVLRERQLSTTRLSDVGGLLARHLARIFRGQLGPAPARVMWFGGAYAALAALAIARADRTWRNRALRAALYFGPVWIALGLAPTIAAGYESPRHAYLAAVGWAILIGLAFDALSHVNPLRAGVHAPSRAWVRVVTLATVAIVALYGVRLHREVSDWRQRAAVSRLATIELERQVEHAPDGALFIVGVPVPSWEWAAPFVARPPYAHSDLTTRASIVTPRLLHCCRGSYWDTDTRNALKAWSAQSGKPIVALYVSPSGEIRRLTDSEEPELRTLVSFLPQIESSDNLDGAILDILRKLVGGRGRVVVKELFPFRTSSTSASPRP